MKKFLFLEKHKDIFKIILLIIALVVFSRVLTYLLFVIRNSISGGEISLIKFLSSLNDADARCYAGIVHFGYNTELTEQAIPFRYNYNFFPLFPILLKFLYLIFPNNNLPLPETIAYDAGYDGTYLFLLAFIFNSILLIFVCLFSYKYVMHTRNNKEMAIVSIILLIFGPFSCYSYEAMSETLFMLLFIMALYCLKKECYIRMGICGAFLSATRAVGVFLALIVLVEIIEKYFRENKQRSFIGFLKYCINKPTLLLGVSLIPLGLICFMIYLQIQFNDGLGFIHTQTYGWGHHYFGFFNILFAAEPIQTVLVLIGLAICFYLIIEKRYYETVLPIVNFLLIGNGTLNSIPRYFFASFTIMCGFLDLLYSVKISNKTTKQVFTYGIVAFLCLYGFIIQIYLDKRVYWEVYV